MATASILAGGGQCEVPARSFICSGSLTLQPPQRPLRFPSGRRCGSPVGQTRLRGVSPLTRDSPAAKPARSGARREHLRGLYASSAEALTTAPAELAEEESRESPPQPSEAKEPEGGGFTWTDNWYCVGAVDSLDPNRPHPVTLLGKRLVLWKDQKRSDLLTGGVPEQEASGTPWRCFLDRCPHRLVPLSEGRIDEQGLLQCSYHGWTFAGDGTCRGIPQAAKAGPEQAAIGSPRACAVPFPVREELGLLFVWPEGGQDAAAKAAATPLPLPKGVKGANPPYRLSTYTRELAYSYDMLAENVMDPSHLPFAHHGVGPLRREKAEPYPSTTVPHKLETHQGYLGRFFEKMSKRYVFVQFRAPSFFAYHRLLEKGEEYADIEGGAKSDHVATFEKATSGELGPVYCTALFITPVTPERCRLTVLEGINRPGAPTLLRRVLAKLKFLRHHAMHDVLDGDSYFLHAQEKALQSLESSTAASHEARAANSSHVASADGTLTDGSKGVSSLGNGSARGGQGQKKFSPLAAYFLPTNADHFVIAFRRWLDRFAGPVPWPAEYRTAASTTSPWLPKEAVLDRYSGHTAECHHCLQALSACRVLQGALRVLAVVLLAVATARGVGMWGRVGLGVLAAAALGASVRMQDAIDRFLYTGYDHAERASL